MHYQSFDFLENGASVTPALFIGLGGSGLDVLLRVRRRLLQERWGRNDDVCLTSLEDFPVADFLYYDQDVSYGTGIVYSDTTDAMAPLVRLASQESLLCCCDLKKYLLSEETLARYPHIDDWLPLRGLQDLSRSLVDYRVCARERSWGDRPRR